MKHKRPWWLTLLPLFLLIGIEVLLFATNYKPGTYLMGWDNIMPEFAFGEHIKRAIFGVWMEYRALGLWDGVSHIATLLHTVTLWVLSIALPQSILRYVFIFSTHALGGIGMYLLLHKLFHRERPLMTVIISLVGALFYLFNIATIQMFFTPLEAFTVHFAALPWLFFSLISYLPTGSRKALLFFCLCLIAVTPQYYIPTFFLPTTIALIGTLATYAFVNFYKHPGKTLKRVGIALGSFILVNAFWLLPYVAGVPHNAPVIASAKINQMSSGEVFARNRAFGTPIDVLLLRGLQLDFEDSSPTRTGFFLMERWRPIVYSPAFVGVSALFALFALIGLVMSMHKKHWGWLPFSVAFIVGFIMLGNDTPYLRDLMDLVRRAVPLLGEAYRFPFTKFSLLFVAAYTPLAMLGVFTVSHWLTEPHHQHVRVELAALTLLLVGYLAYPSFQGNFVSDNLRVALPQEYLNLFAYMQTQPAHERIALFPQPSYWSWKYYTFNLRGSGFLWEGLPQPTMDRAFDPWSHESENYYWEISYALYKKDKQLFAAVLDKYNIHSILLDEYIYATNNERTLFIDETKDMLAHMPAIVKTKQFGKLTLYERSDDRATQFVSLYPTLPVVYPSYRWTDQDAAFETVGPYTVAAKQADADILFPYRELFTKRSVEERTVTPDLAGKTPLYDSANTDDLSRQKLAPCGLIQTGRVTKDSMIEEGVSFTRFTSVKGRGCVSFGIPQLPHSQSYVVAVESRHVSGRPLLFSLINKTARHTEEETYLPEDTGWKTSYFILPSLAIDGLDYTVYMMNDAIGQYETVNDIRRVRIYPFPYDQLVRSYTIQNPTFTTDHGASVIPIQVDHPFASFYRVTVPAGKTGTLALYQAYNKGWVAFTVQSEKFKMKSLQNHVVVNGWANGWIVSPDTPSPKAYTLYIVFWPQLLEYVGFLLAALPFLWVIKKQH